MKIKTIETDGITYIEPVPGATSEWYYGMDYEHGDLYEAEELFKDGHVVKGRKLCLVHFPDGEVFFPIPVKTEKYQTGMTKSYMSFSIRINLSTSRDMHLWIMLMCRRSL
jgi:hypothetical protein